jgi:hypothetical protein
MNRSVTVYTRQPVALEALLARLKALGTPVAWTPSFPVSQGTDWSEGDFGPEGGGDWRIELFEEDLVPSLRESAISAYREVMTEPQRQAVTEARRAFRFSVTAAPLKARDRVLSSLAVAIAELGDGVIADSRTNRVYDAAAYGAAPFGGTQS